ncbi:cytochrome P450 [Nocardia sp. R6R-6]|uniref:cytochrome P450 n=1 Tax=Nocardia sp. R6R-6 TaxID=3459303 RepID=UPI00403DAA6C
MTLTLDSIPEIDLTADDFQGGVRAAEAVYAGYRDGVGYVRSQRGLEPLSYAESARVMRDPRFNASVASRLGGVGITSGVVYETFVNALQNREGPAHTVARKAANPWFNATNANNLRSYVRRWVAEWLDEQRDVEVVDFHNTVGRRLPSTLFCQMAGVSLDHWTEIAQWSEDILLMAQAANVQYREIVERSAGEAKQLIDRQLASCRVYPGDDLFSFLVQAQDRGEVTGDDVMAVVWLALFGSTDTTNAQLNLHLLTLAKHPEAWRHMKQDPSLIPNAVLELSRFNPNVWAVMRSPKEPLDYHGIPLEPTDILWPNVFAANRDPAVFADPGRLDITRHNSGQLLNFATGTHSCLGRMITLMEQEEVLRALIDRWDGCEIVNARFGGSMYAARAEELTVRFVTERG